MKKMKKIGTFHVYEGDQGVSKRLVKDGVLSEENIPETTEWDRKI